MAFKIEAGSGASHNISGDKLPRNGLVDVTAGVVGASAALSPTLYKVELQLRACCCVVVNKGQQRTPFFCVLSLAHWIKGFHHDANCKTGQVLYTYS